MLLGSGTVTTANEAEDTIEPARNSSSVPACTEVIAATKSGWQVEHPRRAHADRSDHRHRAGADYVKIFPCSAMGGASYLKSLLAPFPHLKLIPTGGVTLETAESFSTAGARALGVGSDLVDSKPSTTAGRKRSRRPPGLTCRSWPGCNRDLRQA